jgi:large subunit ribosomal protein L13
VKKYTPSAKTGDVQSKWYIVDASDAVLGRLASTVAARLRGKHNPFFTPHVDTGDFVIVVNAEKIKLTGNKWVQKLYHRHTGYIGGLKTASARELKEKRPEELIRRAVKGMLPKNKLGSRLYTKLKVYQGKDHPHTAQRPEQLKF